MIIEALLMSKRITKKDTILTCPFIRKQCEDMAIVGLQKMHRFVYEQTGNNRSSSKTDVLHSLFENLIYSAFGGYSDHYKAYFPMNVEKLKIKSNKSNKIRKIKDMYDKDFHVDISLNDENGNLNSVFLLKAPLTSINKNVYNMINSNFGEINRFFGNREHKNCKLIFVNFIPVQSFFANGENLENEKTKYIGLTDGGDESPLAKSILQEEYKKNIHCIDIHYNLELGIDLNDIHNKQMLSDVFNTISNRQFITLNDDSFDSFFKYIDSFINEHKAIFN